MTDAPKTQPVAKSTDETYDDRPIPTQGALPPEVQAPLARFGGERPPAPQWFTDALADEPERMFVESLGTKLELLVWGEKGKPGLLLAHGNSAHAEWWSFIAPFLAKDYRVASMSLAGMGQSDWRDSYAFTDFAEDAEACARAAGLYDAPVKPIYVGHSFGGSQVFFAAMLHPERMRAAILVDTGFGGPPPAEREAMEKRMAEVRNIPSADRPSRIYPTLTAALARFRLMPPQAAGQLYVADFIARKSLKQVPMPDGSGMGWTWRFDPEMWTKLDRNAMMGIAPSGKRPEIVTPMIHIFGANSRILRHRTEGQPSPLPAMPEISIPESEHHVMIDQPLALVTALRTALAVWPA